MAAHSFSTSALVAVFIWICSVCSAMAGDICSYLTNDYNYLDMRYEQMVSFKTCQWGCCWKYTDPCCSMPVGLIIGCSIGGFLCLSLVMLAVCCCCCRQPRSRPGLVVSYADSRVAFNSNTAMPADTTASLPPGVYAPPPSYDEVMSGEYNINPAFKPDSPVQ